MSDLPEHLEKRDYDEEEVGDAHGDVTGAWRIVRNGMIMAVVIFAGIYLVYA